MVKAATPNEQIVLDLLNSVSLKDNAATARLLHDEVVWTPMVVGLKGSGSHIGKAAVLRGLLAFPSRTFRPGDPTAAVDRVASSGDFVMAESRTTGVHLDGRVYENTYAWAVELRGGLAFRVRHYFDSFHAARFFKIEPA